MHREPTCFVVIPTYHRDDHLRLTLENISEQTAPPLLEIIVVDNGSLRSCRELCGEMAESGEVPIRYVDAGTNLGAAGATALGMSLALQHAGDSDWIVRCDDDSPRPPPDLLRNIVEEAERLRSADERVAGVGMSGSRFDYRHCRLVKPPNSGAAGVVDVDYLATNLFPFFSVGAIRDVGTFREDLFFGHDEVEFGLRLRRHGYRLCRIDLAGQQRRPSSTSWRLGSVGWRRYYSLRNIIAISREYCGPLTTLRLVVVRGFLKPVLNLLIEPRNALGHLRLNTRAVLDAYRGRMGRTLEPRLVGAELDLRQRPVGPRPPWGE